VGFAVVSFTIHNTKGMTHMATITKKAAKRINELLADARLYETLGNQSAGDGTGDYYRHAYREGVAVRALFDEFGIEGDGLSYFTEDKVEEMRIASMAARQAA
jgi:hypothetical protein